MSAEPREGLEGSLPDCLRIAVFGGWRAWFHDSRNCHHVPVGGRLIYINVDPIVKWVSFEAGEVALPIGGPAASAWRHNTHDSDEAEVLWLQAQERLRTGELE